MPPRRYFGGPQPPNSEFVVGREQQAWPDARDNSGALANSKQNELATTVIGDPPTFYDVRCIFDSRPVSAYDGNFATSKTVIPHGGSNVTSFLVPVGFRFVAREWRVFFNPTPIANMDQVVFFPQANGADVPNNMFYIGSGTTDPIKTFFLVDENASFGARVVDNGGVLSGEVFVQVYGNLLPVTGVALPFEVTNRKI